MLTDKVEILATIGFTPQPTLDSVESSAVLIGRRRRRRAGGSGRARKIPERNAHLLAVDPSPNSLLTAGSVGQRFTNGTQPILTTRIGSMSAIQFPAEKALQGWRRFVHQRTSANFAQTTGRLEVGRLIVVENVTFAVVGCRRSEWLVAE